MADGLVYSWHQRPCHIMFFTSMSPGFLDIALRPGLSGLATRGLPADSVCFLKTSNQTLGRADLLRKAHKPRRGAHVWLNGRQNTMWSSKLDCLAENLIPQSFVNLRTYRGGCGRNDIREMDKIEKHSWHGHARDVDSQT